MDVVLQPVAIVTNARKYPTDDHWADVVTDITLADGIPDEALCNIEAFSHLELIFFMDRVPADSIVFHGRPRGNPAWPDVGIFAQRKKDRPNRIGHTIVRLLEHQGRTLRVSHCDAIDGTPILDIKPVMKEFLPIGEIRQPAWATEIMSDYW